MIPTTHLMLDAPRDTYLYTHKGSLTWAVECALSCGGRSGGTSNWTRMWWAGRQLKTGRRG